MRPPDFARRIRTGELMMDQFRSVASMRPASFGQREYDASMNAPIAKALLQ